MLVFISFLNNLDHHCSVCGGFCVCALAMVGTHVEFDVGVSTVALHLSF